MSESRTGGLDLEKIAARLKAATPGPWYWGEDWDRLDYQGPEGGGDKYADLQLRGPNQHEVIPIRIDHYEPIWDCGNPNDGPTAADRALIAHAPEDIAALLKECEALRTALRPRQTFFQKCWDAARQGYSMDGGEIQDWGEELGLLVRVEATEPCGEGCVCAEYTNDFPTDCYRPAPMPDVGAPRGEQAPK